MDAARRDSATSVVHPSDASSGLPRNHTADFRIDFARPFGRQLFRQPSRGWQHFPRKSVESPPDKLRPHTDLTGHRRGTKPAVWITSAGGGRHSEHLGYLLTELQYLQRAYPGLQW